jgi:hypothetical protein
MMESTIGGALLDIWVKGSGQQKIISATSEVIFNELKSFVSQKSDIRYGHMAKSGIQKK